MRSLLPLRAFVLLGALLMFGMEPLVGRLLLPLYGGSFQVWTTCLMFFQGALLLGYLYVHGIAPRIGRGHFVFLLLPLVLLPIAPWAWPPDHDDPILSIIVSLTLGVGLPFVALGSTAVLAQRWLADSSHAEREDPYVLYSFSNGGSLVALLAYPLLAEPLLGLTAQRWAWSAGYLVYVLVAIGAWASLPKREAATTASATASATLAATPDDAAPSSTEPAKGPPGARDWAVWLLLSAIPSGLLLAVTNVIALDVGSMPLVWVIPLAIYLSTFILIFGRSPVYPDAVRRLWPLVAAAGVAVQTGGYGSVDLFDGLLHLVVLFIVCLVGHGELHRERPAPEHLTKFYLALGIGGWVGGVFVSLGAPLIFNGLYEYPLLIGALMLVLAVLRREALRSWLGETKKVVVVAMAVYLVGAAVFAVKGVVPGGPYEDHYFHRNFYGLYRVRDYEAKIPPELIEAAKDEPGALRVLERNIGLRVLLHGTTNHGAQRWDEAHPERNEPVHYYHPHGAFAQLMRVTGERGKRTAAIVGLGAGVLVSYFDEGEEVVYYELDPDNDEIAREWFGFLDDATASLRVVEGDARLRIEEDAAANGPSYDLIVIDAFSSDAIPTHLLTVEAMRSYGRALKPGGVLALHVSNRYYELIPVVAATAEEAFDGKRTGLWVKRHHGLAKPYEIAHDLILFTDDEALLDRFRRGEGTLPPKPTEEGPLLAPEYIPWHPATGPESKLPKVPAWTDDYASIIGPLWLRISPPQND